MIVFQITAGFKVPSGKYVIVTGLMDTPETGYGFVLRLSGQIVPTESAHSMANQVQLAGDVNTDTHVAKKVVTSDDADGDGPIIVDDENWIPELDSGGQVDPSKL